MKHTKQITSELITLSNTFSWRNTLGTWGRWKQEVLGAAAPDGPPPTPPGVTWGNRTIVGKCFIKSSRGALALCWRAADDQRHHDQEMMKCSAFHPLLMHFHFSLFSFLIIQRNLMALGIWFHLQPLRIRSCKSAVFEDFFLPSIYIQSLLIAVLKVWGALLETPPTHTHPPSWDWVKTGW